MADRPSSIRIDNAEEIPDDKLSPVQAGFSPVCVDVHLIPRPRMSATIFEKDFITVRPTGDAKVTLFFNVESLDNFMSFMNKVHAAARMEYGTINGGDALGPGPVPVDEPVDGGDNPNITTVDNDERYNPDTIENERYRN